MGKQSSRIYYQGKDHKDIYFQKKYHEKMYKGSTLVWEKLYPESYFVGTSDAFMWLAIIAKEYADTKKTLQVYYYFYYTNETIAADINFGNVYVTKDLIHFKDTGEYLSNLYGTIKNKFFFRNFVIDVNKELECEKIDISYPDVDDFSKFSGLFFYNFGNYGVLSEIHTTIDSGTYTYLIVNENGEVEIKKDVISFSTGNESSQDIYEKTAMVPSIIKKYGYGIKIVLGDYVYYAVNGRYFKSAVGGKDIIVSGRIIRRNLITFEREIVHDFGIPLSTFDVSISFICFASHKKIVAACYVLDESNNTLYPYILTINANGASTLKPITKFSVKVYGKNNQINIIPVRTSLEREDNSLYLFYNYRPIGGTGHGNDDFTDSRAPSINNGFVELDSIDGMAVEFNSNLGFGYVYFDNLDFSASEKNYVYFVENMED